MSRSLADFVREALEVVEEISPEGAAQILEKPDRADWEFIDVREPDEFAAGHIPGAGNLPIEDLFDADGMLRTRTELTSLLNEAGVAEGDTVVAYCHIGLRATAVILAARAAGFEALLYDGSMSEWGRDSSLPLERGPGNR